MAKPKRLVSINAKRKADRMKFLADFDSARKMDDCADGKHEFTRSSLVFKGKKACVCGKVRGVR